jgi:NTP pyrophosphatase (non-canonical NTP hydrolase)
VASPACLACTIEQSSFNFSVTYPDTQHTCTKNPVLNSSTNSKEDASSTASAYTFDSYQDDAGLTAIYPLSDTGGVNAVVYTALGLAGEAGEVANKVKKVLRDHDGNFNNETQSAIRDEIGDVLWYCARLASELSLSFGDIAADNIRKLTERKSRNVLRGSGDDR